MFQQYLLPVKTAVALFPTLALLVVLPVAFVSYRRRGRAGGWATLVVYSMLFYLLAALLQTLMPLPADPVTYCDTYGSAPAQLRPFQFVADFVREQHGVWTLRSLATNRAVWSNLLNVLLLLPLGVYLRYLFRRGLTTTVLTAFGVSLFFEFTQLTGLWFVYPCAYRTFDVDDLLMNTAGAALGWALAGPASRILPVVDPAGEHERYAERVTVTRRLLALAADLLAWLLATGTVGCLLSWLPGAGSATRGITVGAAVGVVWFWLIPVLGGGSTLGKRLVLLWLRDRDGTRAGAVRLLVRQTILLTPLWIPWLTLGFADRLPQRLYSVLLIVTAVAWLGWVWCLGAALSRRPTPYERLTGVVNLAVPRTAAANRRDELADGSARQRSQP